MPEIVGSVISKCDHGIYLASDEEQRRDKARYCLSCTPQGPHGSETAWKQLVAANPILKRTYDKSSCPSCGSETHYVQGLHWVCSECGNQWRPARRIGSSLMSIRRI